MAFPEVVLPKPGDSPVLDELFRVARVCGCVDVERLVRERMESDQARDAIAALEAGLCKK